MQAWAHEWPAPSIDFGQKHWGAGARLSTLFDTSFVKWRVHGWAETVKALLRVVKRRAANIRFANEGQDRPSKAGCDYPSPSALREREQKEISAAALLSRGP